MTDDPQAAAHEAEKPDPWWAELETERAARSQLHARLEETRSQLAWMIDRINNQPRDPSIRPWWAPDAQGMLAGSIVAVTGIALFVRMFHASATEDKMLDTMITILFSTCLVTVYQYTFGSSRGSSAKDDTQNKLVEKLMPPPATSSTTTTKTGDA